MLFRGGKPYGPIVSKTQEGLEFVEGQDALYKDQLSDILDKQQQVKENAVPVRKGPIRLADVAQEIQVLSGSIKRLAGAAGVDVNGVEAQLAANGAKSSTLGVRITQVGNAIISRSSVKKNVSKDSMGVGGGVTEASSRSGSGGH